MLDFVKSAFRGLFVVLLWIIPFGLAIAGCLMGWNTSNSGGYAFLGLIIGGLAGLIMSIVFGGFVATIIAIEENTCKDR
jgi:hypothetical protein